MSARDDLVDLLENAVDDAVYFAEAPPSLSGAVARIAADAILAAGYRKPRRVTAREEIEALPIDTVLLSDTIAYQNCGDGDWAAVGRFYHSTQITLPAYVLHEPTVHAA